MYTSELQEDVTAFEEADTPAPEGTIPMISVELTSREFNINLRNSILNLNTFIYLINIQKRSIHAQYKVTFGIKYSFSFDIAVLKSLLVNQIAGNDILCFPYPIKYFFSHGKLDFSQIKTFCTVHIQQNMPHYDAS